MRSFFAVVVYVLAVGLVIYSQTHDLWEDTRNPRSTVSQDIFDK